jgi:Ca-activated chloride channel family protein
MRARSRFVLILALALAMTSVLAGCGATSEELSVLAGSELKDIEPLLGKIRREAGVSLDLEYIGTLDGAEKLMAGQDYDLAWFSHAKYLTLLQGARGRIAAQEKTMLSPVILGVKESKADAWGWTDNPDLTWRDIVDKAGSGELRFGMTNPASSNTGFTALVGVASALAGSADALKAGDIDRVSGALQQFFQGQALNSGSSGWLAESYVREQDRLDGLINYESVLLSLNESRDLAEELVLIYPKEGIITADYPLMLINDQKRESYDKLVEVLRSPEFQEELMTTTKRRPVNPQVQLGSDFPERLLVELPFPNNLGVIDQLIFSYLDEQRIPAHSFFVLDVSGSMRGEGIRDLKGALLLLAGTDDSLTGQFARFRDRERISLFQFNEFVYGPDTFDVDIEDPDTFTRFQLYAHTLKAGGGTAIFSALREAYRHVQEAIAEDPSRYYTIVLMSDGKNTDGIARREFLSYYRSLRGEVQTVKTFTILFGSANEKTMEAIAEATGGRVFDAKSEPLSFIFKKIRGYQ